MKTLLCQKSRHTHKYRQWKWNKKYMYVRKDISVYPAQYSRSPGFSNKSPASLWGRFASSTAAQCSNTIATNHDRTHRTILDTSFWRRPWRRHWWWSHSKRNVRWLYPTETVALGEGICSPSAVDQWRLL